MFPGNDFRPIPEEDMRLFRTGPETVTDYETELPGFRGDLRTAEEAFESSLQTLNENDLIGTV